VQASSRRHRWRCFSLSALGFVYFTRACSIVAWLFCAHVTRPSRFKQILPKISQSISTLAAWWIDRGVTHSITLQVAQAQGNMRWESPLCDAGFH